jgi:hypothetical protein
VYRAITAPLPRSTMRQRRAFTTYLANDHSWYKKLPLHGPGEPFVIFLDPHVHMSWRDSGEGDGELAWRKVIAVEDARHARGRDLRIEGRPEPEPGLSQQAKGRTTDERVADLGHWTYWNYGDPGQPREEAVAAAARAVRVRRPDGVPVAVPSEVLRLGLVYLRATISGHLGPREEEYRRLQTELGLPDPEDDCRAQRTLILQAMEAVTAWVHEA